MNRVLAFAGAFVGASALGVAIAPQPVLVAATVAKPTIGGCGTVAIPKGEMNNVAELRKDRDCFTDAANLAWSAAATRRQRLAAIETPPPPKPTPTPSPTPKPVTLADVQRAGREANLAYEASFRAGKVTDAKVNAITPLALKAGQAESDASAACDRYAYWTNPPPYAQPKSQAACDAALKAATTAIADYAAAARP